MIPTRVEEGEALIERIEGNALSAEDRQVLVKVLTFYFVPFRHAWLTFIFFVFSRSMC
jgi:hypothetical protein